MSGGLVVTRALVRDLHEGVQAGRQLTLMGMMMGFMPIIAPIVGGLLLTFHGWRTGFVFQFACGALAHFWSGALSTKPRGRQRFRCRR